MANACGLARLDALVALLRHCNALHLAPAHESMLWDYLERAAWSMVNTLE